MFGSCISIRSYPFVRLLLSLTSGIYLQFHFPLSFEILFLALTIFSIACLIIHRLSPTTMFRFRMVAGMLFLGLFFVLGMLLTWMQDVRNHKYWFGKDYQGEWLCVSLLEPLVEKGKTYKALCKVEGKMAASSNALEKATGQILLYIKKEEIKPELSLGSRVLVSKPVVFVRNSGNPGALNYARYCLFQGITHQVFLTYEDLIKLPERDNYAGVRPILFSAREKTLSVLRKYISGEKELGIAEALLIGYRNDLDRDLVQQYSNTGVVHIIAISGLHLGMIYLLLIALLSPFKKRKGYLLIKTQVVLFILWSFTFIAGAVPSVLRAAVMFSVFQLAEWVETKPNGIATLTASAFILLVINPFFLWDVGFQLSYAAVVGIMLFYQPFYRLLYFQNTIIDKIWQLNAVTIAAQVLTTPISILYFHQVPNLFWLANTVAVPASGVILYVEIALLTFSWWRSFATLIGQLASYGIGRLNQFIAWLDAIPFAVTDGLRISTIQAVLLLLCILLAGTFAFRRKIILLVSALCCLLTIMAGLSWKHANVRKQLRMVVYNVPNHTAIEFISGKQRHFLGDTALLSNQFLHNFNLKPAHVKFGTYRNEPHITQLKGNPVVQFGDKKCWIVTGHPSFDSVKFRIAIDFIIICRNARINWSALQETVSASVLIFDGSNSRWNAASWQKDCHQLHLRSHNTHEQGAFVVKL